MRATWIVAVLAGVVHGLSVAAPWDGQPKWYLQLLALGTLAGLVASRPGVRRAAFLGWLFATAWLGTSFWWLFVAMHTYGGLPALLAVLAVGLLAAVLAIYYAAACAAYAHWARRGRYGGAITFGAGWMLAEMARAVWFTGFGWGASAYAHVDGPLAGYAPWIGAFGLCGLVGGLCMAGAIAANTGWKARSSQRWLPGAGFALLVCGGVLVLPLNWPAKDDPAETSGRLTVALLQGNIPQDEKFQPGSGVPQALDWFGEKLRSSAGALIVAPETAIPLLPEQLPPGYLETLQRHFSDGSQAALIGIPLGDFSQGYTNSIIGIKPGQGALWRYDKHHLVPFGEFIPPLFRWFTEMMNIPLGDFNRGAIDQASFEWQGQRLAANICYEDLFGEELARRFLDPDKAPTIFVNSSNIGWFGDSVAIDQHLQISRMRAIEFRRPFVRATNTGATVIVDHHGRITASLPRYTRGVLEGEVEGRTGITPYAWWVARLGLWPFWLVAVATLVMAWWQRRRTRGSVSGTPQA